MTRPYPGGMAEKTVEELLANIEGAATRELVTSDAPIIRVVAGPGAGKTYALKLRVKRRVREGMDPKRIFVGTFTRAVARALTKDFSAEEDERPPVVGTLHQLALKVLKENPGALKGRILKFLLRHEADCLLADIGPAVGGDMRARREWMKQLEAGWSRGDPLGQAAFEGAVNGWLRSHRGMVIGEVVPIVSQRQHRGHVAAQHGVQCLVEGVRGLFECGRHVGSSRVFGAEGRRRQRKPPSLATHPQGCWN